MPRSAYRMPVPRASSEFERMPLLAPEWQAPGAAQRGAVDALCRALRERHGDCVAAVLFYGSCLRSGNPWDGLVDLYLIVDDYGRAHGSRLEALANALLPPNVYYLQLTDAGRTVRCKYAVLSAAQLCRAVSPRWFQSYVWGRFCQPVAMPWCRDANTASVVRAAVREAAATCLARALPMLPRQGSLLQLWQQALSLSYRTELRAEHSGRAADIASEGEAHFLALARELATLPGAEFRIEQDRYIAHFPPHRRCASRLAWWLRTAQGKCLSVLRLVKALFTFEGGLDYLAWKLERHSGQKILVPERVRRHPLLFVWPFMLQLYRRGVFR